MAEKVQKFVTEVPSELKQLARLVVRGFYAREDALIIDMLVRNPSMKEDDIAELLHFEKKQLRARISTLRNDKFLQMRLKMETGPDGKAQKVSYYFINYKTFVNVVKYKLDLMRKRLETEERDATSRANFKCTICSKTFTDLEIDQLYDFETGEMRCPMCGGSVDEDSTAMPKKDSRLMMARFNEQMQVLYDLLREVENIKLAPELLEPEPVDINTIRGQQKNTSSTRPDGEQWSGEATRRQGFAVEEARIEVSIDGDSNETTTDTRKSRASWLTKSTIGVMDAVDDGTDELTEAAQTASQPSTSTAGHNNRNRKDNIDIMSVLLQYEKPANKNSQDSRRHAASRDYANGGDSPHASSSDSADENDIDNTEIPNVAFSTNEPIDLDPDSDVEEENVPMVLVSGKPHPIDKINDELIAQMTEQEKENYIHVYQQLYSHMYD